MSLTLALPQGTSKRALPNGPWPWPWTASHEGEQDIGMESQQAQRLSLSSQVEEKGKEMLLAGWLGWSVCMSQVVEGELARVPPHIARRHSANQQLWSITYLPQVQRRLRVAAAAQLRASSSQVSGRLLRRDAGRRAIGYAIQVTGQALAEELLEYLEDYERAFEGHCEQGYAVSTYMA
ncbi:hypothetical protein QJQ45_030465, partial [Haematococcus lacustris]